MKIYIDMDGVLAKWNTKASVEDTFEKGYFLKCVPDTKMIELTEYISMFWDVSILSHAYENGYAEAEKMEWLDAYGLDEERISRIFVPYGIPKAEFLHLSDNRDTLFLIDDFSKNLINWESYPNCYGIKYYNGINGTHGTWNGESLSCTDDLKQLMWDITQMIKGKE